jgi:hypothetical protein
VPLKIFLLLLRIYHRGGLPESHVHDLVVSVHSLHVLLTLADVEAFAELVTRLFTGLAHYLEFKKTFLPLVHDMKQLALGTAITLTIFSISFRFSFATL